jgi:enoyl-CoA hydratase/carnithine racemase
MKVALSSDSHTYRVTLSDPPLHILDIPMLEELRETLGRVASDRHALIIDASGERAFSAGVSVQDHLGDRAETMLSTFHDCFRILARLELVTVALVRGLALGGGCELAMACDFVLASDRAAFGQPEINLGVFPPVAAYQLSRLTAPRKGLELLLTSDALDAAAAERVVAPPREESVPPRAGGRLRRAPRARRASLPRRADADRRRDGGTDGVPRKANAGLAEPLNDGNPALVTRSKGFVPRNRPTVVSMFK